MIYTRPYSRFYFRKSYAYIVFALIMLVMSWEGLKNDAAVIPSSIPDQAIRLRILANSDTPVDQAVKRVVRDEVVAAMDGWVTEPQTIEEARQTIRSHMPELESIVAEVLESRGFTYSYHAQLGVVPFPTKMYGDEVYPAGDYEALLITLGEGKGQNWWCVLFPPLCFIDAVTGEASASEAAATPAEDAQASQAAADKPSADAKSSKTDSAQTAGSVKAADQAGAGHDAAKNAAAGQGAEAPHVKFFLVELIEKLIHWLKALFA
ncbi:stage II sporulation protein R [Paenibacillus protaetiae]|uniref:Stage II sporulation protein R n=1 Tax=Paenibacillus protaetiae TaxID=2509456 RepID=A0A4P6EZG3_9BACL|nr:stage II sporulation protein R [Paenibacillus protaetiae]QAY67693.1 stage II sporulation protein R [Paenibacillus protaetiae]